MRKVILLLTVLFLAIVGAVGCSGNLEQSLIEAVKQNDKAGVEELLREGADPNAVDERYGSNAVMWAAHEGHRDMLILLLEKGGDPNARNPLGRTALWFTAQKGQAATAEVLIKHGVAEINPASTKGITALQIARENQHDGVLRLLRQAGAAE